jgi:uncharacterized membrane protein
MRSNGRPNLSKYSKSPLTQRLEIEGMAEAKEQPTSELNSEQGSQVKVSLTASSEGLLLLVGVTLAFIFTLWLGIKLLLSPEESQVLIGMTATEIMFGRAAGMAFGYSLGLGHSTVIPICMIIETTLVLIFYPLFVFSWRHLLVIKWLKNTFERIHKAAEVHKNKIQRYGIIGLFIFVWFPFWMTGPVVGCVIGFMIGLKIRLNMTIVLAGTYAAILGWAFFLKRFHDRVASYSSYAAMVLMGLLVIIIILGHLMYRTLHEHKNKT